MLCTVWARPEVAVADAAAESMAAFQRQANTEARTWIMQQIKCGVASSLCLPADILLLMLLPLPPQPLSPFLLMLHP